MPRSSQSTVQSKPEKSAVQTLELTNFSGPLTRVRIGKINSGQAKFQTSFGYDPFSKPGQLTWLEQPTSIAGINDLVEDAKIRFESDTTYIYAIGNTGNLYKIQPNGITSPNIDSVVAIASVKGGSHGMNYDYGASIDFFAATEKIYVGGDNGIAAINFDGTGDTFIGNGTDYTSNIYRPLAQFLGYLAFGNGTNIGLIDTTGTIISSVVSGKYAQLSPGFPQETHITDIDQSVDGNYLNLTTTSTNNEEIDTVSSDRQAASGGQGGIFYWNGVDTAITKFKQIPSYAVTAMQVYLNNNYFFENDSFGASLSDGTKKIISLPNVKSPFANATTTNGNFICWISPELTSDGTGMVGSLFYFGQLDESSPKGLWRVLRYSTSLANGFVYQTPVNILTNNKYSTVNNAVTSIVTMGYGKHYFSSFEVNSTNTNVSSITTKLSKFLITSSGTGTPQLGVYETQNELFSKRISLSEIRVYCEPTASGNGFQLDIIDNDGTVVTNGTFTYTYASGTDITKLQGALERINFNPNMKDLYSVGIRVTNTGTTNMTISKIEVDWEYSGR